jgi:plastocyanin
VEVGPDGFSPKTINVTAGGNLTFKNTSSATIQVDSDPHPQHTDNPELNVGQIVPGQTVTITVAKTGTWGIHNHLEPSMKATVVVK